LKGEQIFELVAFFVADKSASTGQTLQSIKTTNLKHFSSGNLDEKETIYYVGTNDYLLMMAEINLL
jgi:hypothetical protein